MTYDDAKNAFSEFILSLQKDGGVPLRIAEEHTIERSFGWVFFYEVDTRLSTEMIAGNGPVIIDKRSGELHACGTAYPDEWYIDNYEIDGRVDG